VVEVAEVPVSEAALGELGAPQAAITPAIPNPAANNTTERRDRTRPLRGKDGLAMITLQKLRYLDGITEDYLGETVARLD